MVVAAYMLMILEQYYLSIKGNLDRASQDTGLSVDEILDMVGIFTKQSSRAGQTRGQVIYKINRKGEYVYEIRHHFTNKKYWSSYD